MALGEATVTIKKVKKVVGHGHHGGAWKVAYADFVTAMMAFFLLMWLINTISVEQKKGLADYFAPASISETTSGAGDILSGTSPGDEGSQGAGTTSTITKLSPDSPNPADHGRTDDASLAAATDAQLREQIRYRQEQAFQQAAESIRQAMQKQPELTELSKQVRMEITEDGLLIELVDQQGSSMFDQGRATPTPRAAALLRAVASQINRLPNRVTLTGHTNIGSSGKTEESDWDLSQRRANESRRILQSNGVNGDRFAGVTGVANSKPLYPDDPKLPGNRRIQILLLNERPALPPPGA